MVAGYSFHSMFCSILVNVGKNFGSFSSLHSNPTWLMLIRGGTVFVLVDVLSAANP